MSEILLPKPILKWAGGKRQLIDVIRPIFPENMECYYEPFLGAGALLFDLMPSKAIVNDINEELVNMYNVIKANPLELIDKLKHHSLNHSKDYYYKIRGLDRVPDYVYEISNIDKAARTIYLNKTCYNGLYRVNRKGQFNTPIGKYVNPNIVNEETILSISYYLSNNDIDIECGDYKNILDRCEPGDFVYLDPPYEPISKSSSFTAYTKDGFNLDSQKELKEMCDMLTRRGIKFLQSNSDSESIRTLYSDYKIQTVEAKRFINSKVAKRSGSKEIIITNY